MSEIQVSENVEDDVFRVPASWEAAVEELRQEGPLRVEEWEARAAAAQTLTSEK